MWPQANNRTFIASPSVRSVIAAQVTIVLHVPNLGLNRTTSFELLVDRFRDAFSLAGDVHVDTGHPMATLAPVYVTPFGFDTGEAFGLP